MAKSDKGPPLSPEQAAFEKFWIDLKGAGFIGFGRDKRSNWDYHAEFARDAWKAWRGAQASSAKLRKFSYG